MAFQVVWEQNVTHFYFNLINDLRSEYDSGQRSNRRWKFECSIDIILCFNCHFLSFTRQELSSFMDFSMWLDCYEYYRILMFLYIQSALELSAFLKRFSEILPTISKKTARPILIWKCESSSSMSGIVVHDQCLAPTSSTYSELYVYKLCKSRSLWFEMITLLSQHFTWKM